MSWRSLLGESFGQSAVRAVLDDLRGRLSRVGVCGLRLDDADDRSCTEAGTNDDGGQAAKKTTHLYFPPEV